MLVGEVYDGPLDLLLDLIRKQDIDIYDIPIAKITAQYLKYVENMKQLDVDVAAEFIYTASLLIHIKSKMLLPRDPDATGLLEDPRMELVNRLLEHERFRTAAQMLLQKQQIEEAVWSNPALKEFRDAEGAEPELAADVVDLVKTFQQILNRARNKPSFEVEEDNVTVSQMIDYRAPATVAGREADPPETPLAQLAVARGAGLCVSRHPGTDTLAGSAGAAGQRVWRDCVEEVHQLRLAHGGKSAGEGRLAVMAVGSRDGWMPRPELASRRCCGVRTYVSRLCGVGTNALAKSSPQGETF